MRIAENKNGFIGNFSKHNPDNEIPTGWFDFTGMRGNIGDPIVNGVPVPKPSRWHTLEDKEWIMTPENQTKKDEFEHVPTKEEIYDNTMKNSKLLKAVVLALNDGSLVPGSNLSGAELKTIIKNKI